MMDNNVSPNNHTNNSELSQEECWLEHIRLRNKSGLNKAAYCRLHNLTVHQYYYWEQKLKASTLPSGLLPIQIISAVKEESVSPVTPCLLCSVTFKNGAELKVYNPAVLTTLVSILG
jgi:hypothetical protein